MAAKPVIEASAPLSKGESQALLACIGSRQLTESRKNTLKGYSAAVQRAFAKRSSF